MSYSVALFISAGTSLLLTLAAARYLFTLLFPARAQARMPYAALTPKQERVTIIEPVAAPAEAPAATETRALKPLTISQSTATRCRRVHVTHPRYKPVSGKTVLYFYS